MSVRESRLCDQMVGGDLCRSPFHIRCWVCEKDFCYEHFGGASVTALIALHTGEVVEGSPRFVVLGSGARMAVCTTCRIGLPSTTRGSGILDALAGSLDDKLIPELRAWLAAQTMKKPEEP